MHNAFERDTLEFRTWVAFEIEMQRVMSATCWGRIMRRAEHISEFQKCLFIRNTKPLHCSVGRAYCSFLHLPLLTSRALLSSNAIVCWHHPWGGDNNGGSLCPETRHLWIKSEKMSRIQLCCADKTGTKSDVHKRLLWTRAQFRPVRSCPLKSVRGVSSLAWFLEAEKAH